LSFTGLNCAVLLSPLRAPQPGMLPTASDLM